MILAPAMNTAMWSHVLTQQQLTTLRGFFRSTEHGHHQTLVIVRPQSKLLACGEYGDGALAEVSAIVSSVVDRAETLALDQIP